MTGLLSWQHLAAGAPAPTHIPAKGKSQIDFSTWLLFMPATTYSPTYVARAPSPAKNWTEAHPRKNAPKPALPRKSGASAPRKSFRIVSSSALVAVFAPRRPAELNLRRLEGVSERSLLAGAFCRNPERFVRRISQSKASSTLSTSSSPPGPCLRTISTSQSNTVASRPCSASSRYRDTVSRLSG